MNKVERWCRHQRIAEIATEILANEWKDAGLRRMGPCPVVDARVVRAVDEARRAEYYERKEQAKP